MTTGEDRNKDRFKPKALRSVKAPVLSPRSNKAHQFVCKIKPFISQFPTVTPLSTRLWLLSTSYRPGLFKFFGRDYISNCTTVRWPDVLRYVIFLGYVAFLAARWLLHAER